MTYNELKLSRPINKGRLALDLAIHEVDNDIIIINYPGLGEDLNGPRNRYLNLANHLQESGMGTIVRMGNIPDIRLGNSKRMRDNLRFTIDYCLSLSETPRLYLMGLSAGASSIASIASDYPSIEKILLIAPSEDVGRRNIEDGLRGYSGEIYFTTGDSDEIADPANVREFFEIARKSKKKEFRIIPKCNHDFPGRDNSMIMSKAPFWAFNGDDSFPSPEGGKVLYD